MSLVIVEVVKNSSIATVKIPNFYFHINSSANKLKKRRKKNKETSVSQIIEYE